MRLLSLAALVSACSFSHGTAPSRDDGGGSNGDDAAVDTSGPVDAPPDQPMPIDAPPDSSMPLDTDGDGVPDLTDNCPTQANTNQRNHDGDSRGDVCDRCPHLSSPNDPDGDSDGVGDACDPRPAAGGDARLVWEGFYDTSSISTWTAGSGDVWTVNNGAATQGNAGDALATLQLPGTVQRASVQTSARIVAITTPTNGFQFPGASVSSGVGGSQFYNCGVGLTDNPAKLVRATSLFQGSNGFAIVEANWPGTLEAGSVIRIAGSIVGTSHRCEAVQGGSQASVNQTPGANTTGAVQLVTSYANVEFDYVFVVAVGN